MLLKKIYMYFCNGIISGRKTHKIRTVWILTFTGHSVSHFMSVFKHEIKVIHFKYYKNLHSTVIWADGEWTIFWNIRLYINISRNLDCVPEVLVQFRMYFRTYTLKSEGNDSNHDLTFYCSHNPFWMSEDKVSV